MSFGHARWEEFDRDPLALSAARMREIGYRTIELLIERPTDGSTSAMQQECPENLRARIASSVPGGPRGWHELLGELDESVLSFMSRLAHPRCFAFIPASGAFPGALGDLIASALDIDAGSGSSAAGPSHLEPVVLEWFKEWLGDPAEAAGILVSGGSAANETALACARETLVGPMADGVVAYVSDQTHSSVPRAARSGATMSALSGEHGAWQVKSMGDGVMIWAPDAARAVALAPHAVDDVGTRPDLLPVRVGVHTGPAVMRGRDWYGSAVNVAARLAGEAEPNEALVSSAARSAACGELTGSLRTRCELVLRGVKRPIVTWRLT